MVAAHARRAGGGDRRAAGAGRGGHAARRPRRPRRRWARACREHDVLLICDEVATGFGRTGTLFASEQCGLRPDLLVLGKGLTGGYLPMSATAASGRVFDAFLGADLGERTLYHGHSYSGNALAAAVALRHLELLDAWSVLENVRARSDELRGLLDDRIAPHPAVAEVRLCGLMGGVELAPPTATTCGGDGGCARPRSSGACSCVRSATWSCSCLRSPSRRRSCTASCTRSPTRSTRVTDVVMSWQDWADHEAKRVRDAEPVAPATRPRPRLGAGGPTGVVDDRNVVSFASNDYLGLTRHPAVVAAAHDALDRWGTGSGSARLIVGSRPVHHELEAALADWKGTEARGALHHRIRRQPRRDHHVRGPRRARLLRRAEPRVDHRRPTARGRAARGLPPLRRRARRRDPGARPISPRAIVVSETVFSMDGDVAPVDELARRVRAPRRAARARRGARGARARRRPRPTTSTCCASARCRRRSARSAGSSPGRARFTDLVVNRARSYIFTTASTPADTAAALAALAVLRSPEGDELRARLRANVDRLRPGHPSPIVPVRLRVGAPRARGRGGAARRGPARHRHPPADGAAGHVAAAGHAVGRAHRRAGRPARRARSASHFPVDDPPAHAGVRGRHRAPKWARRGGPPRSRAELRAAGVTVAARKPVQSAAPGEPLDADVLAAATGDDPDTRVPRAPHLRHPVGTADGRRRAGAAAVHRRRPRGRARLARRRSRRPRRRRRRASLPDQRPTATTSTSRASLAPDLVVLVADAGLGTINAVRLSAARVRRLPADRRAQPLRRRPAARRATCDFLADRRRASTCRPTPRARSPDSAPRLTVDDARRSSSVSRASARAASTASRSRPTACTSSPCTASPCSSSTAPARARRSPTTTTAPPAPSSWPTPTTCGRAPSSCSRSRSRSPRSSPTSAPGWCSSPTSTSPRTPRSPTRCSSTASSASPTRRCSSSRARCPLLAPMSEVAGRMAPQVGSHFLEREHGGRGVLLGGAPGVRPARVVVIGAGNVGWNAAWIAQGMEAEVLLLRPQPRPAAVGRPDPQGPDHDAGEQPPRGRARGRRRRPRHRRGARARRARAGRGHRRDGALDARRARSSSTARSTRAVASRTSTRRRTPTPCSSVTSVLHYAVGNIPGAVPHTSTYALTNATLPYALALATLGVDAAVHARPRARGRRQHRRRAGHERRGRRPRSGRERA